MCGPEFPQFPEFPELRWNCGRGQACNLWIVWHSCLGIAPALHDEGGQLAGRTFNLMNNHLWGIWG